MDLLIELWKARSAWHRQAPVRREEYLSTVIPAINQLLSDGVALVAMEANTGRGMGEAADGRGPHDYDYWAIWRLAHEGQRQAFTQALEEVGWLDFFERVTLDVEASTVEDLLGR